MRLNEILSKEVAKVVSTLWNNELSEDSISIQDTRKEFEGDRTLVVFPFLKWSKLSPEETAKKIGERLSQDLDIIVDFNVVKGFLNLVIADHFWLEWLKTKNEDSKVIDFDNYMVEYSSPNTNKPLHLGHIRNNLLGYSVSKALEAKGHSVVKTQVINDRGIHICKSMLAWKKFGEGERPDQSKMKGDHLVGKYYVRFNTEYKKEVTQLVEKGMDEKEAEKSAPILLEAQQMLRDWESRDKEVVGLWKKMNAWVYDGFDTTYENLGVNFDKLYYESDTYLKGKEEVLKGVESGIFEQDPDGSVWVDLTDEGLDRKILIRSDGTSVYMTQDIGTALLRFKDYPELKHLIYTVGNEQNYHFKVLFLILKKIGFEWADGCQHLSYGMVELPSGKMKSREGTVVDADDLIQEMIDTARAKSIELGKLEGVPEKEREKLFRMIGLAALKYYILKVDPKKQMVFNPEESIDFNGNTGPFIQYTHARICTILKKVDLENNTFSLSKNIEPVEKEIIKQLYLYNQTLDIVVKELNPAIMANYIFDLVKLYNQFYQSIPILKEENEQVKRFRLTLSSNVGEKIKSGMEILGIDVPNQM